MKRFTLKASIALLILLTPVGVFASEDFNSIRIKTDFNIWKVNLDRLNFVENNESHFINDIQVELPNDLQASLSSDVSEYLSAKTTRRMNFEVFKKYLDENIAPEINREKQDVTISQDENDNIIFDGFAIKGQEIDYEKAFYLIEEAIKMEERDVRLPIRIIEPVINVESEWLASRGITHLISTGETNFAGSPANRRTNIRVGLASFNGTLVEPWEETGAGKILGRIDETTGYKEELVIKGDKTIPEYGGGLCQVSTTVYRSILFAGLPITQRRNHSYSVSYYDPQGLDATIYPPTVDMKFLNDTDKYILIQAGTIGDKAYANIYGTPQNRYVDLIGPNYYDYRKVPDPRTEYTDQLPAGTKQILGGAHEGFKASWYRRITYASEGKEDKLEHIYSDYQARPLYTLIGEGSEESAKEAGNILPGIASENGT